MFFYVYLSLYKKNGVKDTHHPSQKEKNKKKQTKNSHRQTSNGGKKDQGEIGDNHGRTQATKIDEKWTEDRKKKESKKGHGKNKR